MRVFVWRHSGSKLVFEAHPRVRIADGLVARDDDNIAAVHSDVTLAGAALPRREPDVTVTSVPAATLRATTHSGADSMRPRQGCQVLRDGRLHNPL